MALSNKFKERFKVAWPGIKTRLLDLLKTEAVKAVLVKILGSAALGGFRTWLIKFAVENLFEQFVEPIIKAGLIKMGYVYHVHEGKEFYERLTKAKKEHDEDDYNSTIGDILN